MKTIYVSQNSALDVMKHIPNIKCLFPEVKDGLPLCPKEILKEMPKVWGQCDSIGTTSEAVILWISKQIRDGYINHKDVIIYQISNASLLGRLETEPALYRNSFDEEGDFNTFWMDGFFNWRAKLLF